MPAVRRREAPRHSLPPRPAAPPVRTGQFRVRHPPAAVPAGFPPAGTAAAYGRAAPGYQNTGRRSGSRFMKRVRHTSWSTGTASWRFGIFSSSTSMAISVCRLPRAVAGQ